VNAQGLGVSGVVDGTTVVVGRPQFVVACGLVIPDVLTEAVAVAESLGRTAVVAGWDGAARVVLVVADTVKAGAADAVASLKALGLRPVLLTGDNEAAARAVAAEVGIDDVIAGVLPDGKVSVVRDLQ